MMPTVAFWNLVRQEGEQAGGGATDLIALPEWLTRYPFVEAALGLVVLILVAWLGYGIARRLILRAIGQFARRTSFTWDDKIIEHKVFDRLAHIAPAAVVYYGIGLVPDLSLRIVQLGQQIALAVVLLVTLLSASNFLTALNDIYQAQYADAKSRPIKGYLQIVKIFLFVMGGIVILATLMGQSPVSFLAGLGALTAVIMLIFKDTILSLVASVQIASNDMIRIGDWIEMPEYSADGDVIDIALHTVKVQNWDKTVTTIPTSKFIEDSFKNWRHMPLSGGRRIKRALHLDLNTVHFLTEQEIERLSRYEFLNDYMKAKRAELAEYNERAMESDDLLPQRRRLTNLGTFRAYVLHYLRHHPVIHRDLTLLVRQLPPGPQGIPLELYCFSTDTAWASYEGIQADIFDHLMAILPEFGLRAYQQPAGSDFRELGRAATHPVA